jgi:hypothetical protein
MPPADPRGRARDVEPPARSSAWSRQITSQVFIRRHPASQICDVVVSVRGQEIILRCPNYPQALKWARLECKSYKISEPEMEPPPEMEPLNELNHNEDDGLNQDEELPIFLHSQNN